MMRPPWERRTGNEALPDFAQDWVEDAAIAAQVTMLRAQALGPLRARVEGAGDLALTLVALGLDEVVLVVRGPGAAACAELRRAAARELPAASIRSFLGWGHFGRRVWFYHYLRPGLPEAARAWLDTREGLVRRGLLGEGVWERRLGRLRSWVGEEGGGGAVRPRNAPATDGSEVFGTPPAAGPGGLSIARWHLALAATCRLPVPGAAPDDVTGSLLRAIVPDWRARLATGDGAPPDWRPHAALLGPPADPACAPYWRTPAGVAALRGRTAALTIVTPDDPRARDPAVGLVFAASPARR